MSLASTQRWQAPSSSPPDHLLHELFLCVPAVVRTRSADAPGALLAPNVANWLAP